MSIRKLWINRVRAIIGRNARSEFVRQSITAEREEARAVAVELREELERVTSWRASRVFPWEDRRKVEREER